MNEAYARSPPREEFPKLDSEFKPSLVNSTVYIISLSLQVATFAINYKGHPFMESLRENKPLLYSIIFSASSVAALAGRLSPEFSDQFQIVEFPVEVINDKLSWQSLHHFNLFNIIVSKYFGNRNLYGFWCKFLN